MVKLTPIISTLAIELGLMMRSCCCAVSSLDAVGIRIVALGTEASILTLLLTLSGAGNSMVPGARTMRVTVVSARAVSISL